MQALALTDRDVAPDLPTGPTLDLKATLAKNH